MTGWWIPAWRNGFGRWFASLLVPWRFFRDCIRSHLLHRLLHWPQIIHILSREEEKNRSSSRSPEALVRLFYSSGIRSKPLIRSTWRRRLVWQKRGFEFSKSLYWKPKALSSFVARIIFSLNYTTNRFQSMACQHVIDAILNFIASKIEQICCVIGYNS